MAYQQGDTITAADYNTFATNINTIIGTGSTDSGYGLSEIAAVSAGNTITAAQWNSLLSGLQKGANHQGTTLTNASNTVAQGGNILPLSNLEADITLITTNKLTAAGANMAADTGITSTKTAAWTGTENHIFTVTFASANAARHFFNSGGEIRLAGSRAGGSSTDQNTDWTNLLSNMGTVKFAEGATTYTGSGGTAASVGFDDLTTSNQQIFTATGAGNYSSNDYTAYAKADAAYGSATVITFTLDFKDDHAAQTGTYTGGGLGTAPNEGNAWSGADEVDGTLTSTITTFRADNASYVQVANPTFATTDAL
mgnify:FL=1|tara:strand:+ start:9961 stop:10893 length:933 start_codon:yes stop_codon:yes gene_type:complete